jgi:hypothetical protein
MGTCMSIKKDFFKNTIPVKDPKTKPHNYILVERIAAARYRTIESFTVGVVQDPAVRG